MKKALLFTALFFVLNSGVAFADHPLITEEAETLDPGEIEISFTGEFSSDKYSESGVEFKEKETEAAVSISVGLRDGLEMEVDVPYQWVKEEETGAGSLRASGVGDLEVSAKWRFYNENDLGFALQPTFLLPTGNEEKELGTGRLSYGLRFVTSKEFDPIGLELHLNVGVTHFEYKIDTVGEENRPNIWAVSFAAQKNITKSFKLLADVGTETNSVKGSDTRPAYILGGVIYSIAKNLDIDFGVKKGITGPAPDIACLAGIKWSL